MSEHEASFIIEEKDENLSKNLPLKDLVKKVGEMISYESLEQYLRKVYIDSNPSLERLRIRDEILEIMNEELKQDFDDVEVTAFGSSSNSLWSDKSDLDVEVAVYSEYETNSVDILNIMLKRLKKYSKGNYIEKIFSS